MTQTVVEDFPPNYADITAVMSLGLLKPIFSYGRKIYNPHKIYIRPSLFAHELVHGIQQGENPADWWKLYLSNPKFRLVEEVPAHQAEYAVACRGLTPNQRVQQLRPIAHRLTAKIYGNLLTMEQAKQAILTSKLPVCFQ